MNGPLPPLLVSQSYSLEVTAVETGSWAFSHSFCVSFTYTYPITLHDHLFTGMLPLINRMSVVVYEYFCIYFRVSVD